jgi:hypothetical protein
MDASAYIDVDKWERMKTSNGWNEIEMRDNRYNQIVHMVSAANGAEQFYSTEVRSLKNPTPKCAHGLVFSRNIPVDQRELIMPANLTTKRQQLGLGIRTSMSSTILQTLRLR